MMLFSQDLFTVSWKSSFVQFVLSPYDIGPSLLSLVVTMGYRFDVVKCIRTLMMIGRWSETRFGFVCKLVDEIREDDANETSGKDALAFLGSLVGES